MDRRKRRKHSPEKLPVGNIRRRTRKRSDGSRYTHTLIKVSACKNAGGGNWINYNRFLWEQAHGPVPKGKRVLCKDGNCDNHALSNLVLGTAGDAAWLYYHRDPQKSAANYRKCREGTARFNHWRARIHRAVSILPSKWYAVDERQRTILNNPKRM